MSRFWCSRYEAVEYKGVVKEAIEWANSKGLAWETVKKRVQRGSGWCKALELTDDDLLPKQHQLFKIKYSKPKKKPYRYKKNNSYGYFQQLCLFNV